MMARLLVVDDEQDIRDLLVKRLTHQGHEVLSADSAAVALMLVQCHGLPDAALLDIDMPGMDGFALLNRLREKRPQLPAAFVTALWGDDVHARIRRACALYVAKPFTAMSLASAVPQMLEPSGCVPGPDGRGL